MRPSFYLTLLFSVCLLPVTGQSVIVKSFEDDSLFLAQLNGALANRNSLCIRPISRQTADEFPKKLKLQSLPLSVFAHAALQHPFGWNDNGLSQSKGIQTYIRGGAYAAYKGFELQLAPELTFSQNTPYRTNSYYGPSKFKSALNLYPGQSYFKYAFKGLGIKLSTENMWWGPGMYNALLLSNNAPGFRHLSFHSEKPKNIGIGKLEWQLIYGELQDTKGQPFENMYNKLDREAYPFPLSTDTTDKRIFNGLIITYNPKWIKGLFLGVSRLFQVYARDFNNNKSGVIDKYLPVLGTLFKGGTTAEDEKGRDQYISIFIKGVFEKEKMSAYIEYGLNDHSEDIRDFLMSPSHSAVYTLGLSKLFSNRKAVKYLLNVELTQMAQSPNGVVRDAGNWYWHGVVHSGLTNRNQILGAGIGAGNNVQTLQFSEIKQNRKRGVVFQQVERDPYFHSIKWTDFAFAYFHYKQFSNFSVGGQLQLVHSINQLWEKNNNKLNPVLELKCDWKIK